MAAANRSGRSVIERPIVIPPALLVSSLDGRYAAVGVSQGGSEDAVLRVLDTATGKETGDAIEQTWFGNPSWLPDGHSFVYNRMQKLGPKSAPTDRELYSRTYLHVLGTK